MVRAIARRLSVVEKNHDAVATIESEIQPSVPEWTWVRIQLRAKSTVSVPLRMPIPTVRTKIAIATR